MQLQRLWLTDFRSYTSAELVLADGLTVVRGPNGSGKTNLLEAAGYLATLSSFRGAPNDSLVRQGCEQAVVRGEGRRGERSLLVEAEVRAASRGRVTLNRQAVRRAHDLHDGFRVSVFSPDDLALVKGAPAGRRRYLDDTLAALHPRHEALCRDVERIVRQRSTLLAQSGGRLIPDVEVTLDVWDAKLTEAGGALVEARVGLLERLQPVLAKAYGQLAGAGGAGRAGAEPVVAATYEAPWRERGLAASLAESRADDLRRGVSLVGPHRDELALAIADRPARTHASQGEQRSLALALRLAAHQVVADELGEPPLLLLDDVFSELDAGRSHALVEHLPPGQALLTTTTDAPPGTHPELVVEVLDSRVVA